MQIHRVTSTELGGLRTSLLGLYRGCFTEPPWNEPESLIEAYDGILDDHLSQPGMFGLVATLGSVVAGAVYGWPAPAALPDDLFHRSLLPFVPATNLPQLVAPAVIVVELMVHPQHQRRGVGRALLNGFVTGHPSAWLCTNPEAPACALYESADWTTVTRYANHRGDPRALYTWTAPSEQDHTWHGTTLRVPPDSSRNIIKDARAQLSGGGTA